MIDQNHRVKTHTITHTDNNNANNNADSTNISMRTKIEYGELKNFAESSVKQEEIAYTRQASASL